MQIIVNGLISGTAIAVLALAFQCIYLPTRVFFIGMAGIYAMTPFVAWSMLRAGGGWWLAISASLALGVLLSLICEWLIHLPMEKKKASSAAHLIASLGASIVMIQITAMIWGNDTKSLRTGLDAVTHLGAVIITGAQWVTFGVGIGLVVAFRLLLMKSDLGLRLRALADNPIQFALFGYNIHLYRTFSFAVGGFLASAAALVTAYDVGFDPHTGLHAVLLAVVAVIIGGRGSFVGPIAGGVLLGVVRAGCLALVSEMARGGYVRTPGLGVASVATRIVGTKGPIGGNGMSYILHLLIYFDIYLIVALSLNLIVGYTGLLSLTHAAFYAVGGYSYALLSINLEWGFVPAALAGVVIAAVLSLIVSLPAWRLRGDFFVLATLAVQALVFSALYNWTSTGAPLGTIRNLTNGPFGITGIPRPTILGWQISNQLAYAVFATVVAALVALVVWRLSKSPWGRLLKAVRDDELAAKGLGKNTRFVKVQVVAIASGLVAIAGALYAGHVRYLDPSSASLNESILMLSMVIVGGLGNFRGPIIGAAILILLPEALRFLALPDAIAANMHLLIYGVLLIVMMQFRPQGIAGEYRLE